MNRFAIAGLLMGTAMPAWAASGTPNAVLNSGCRATFSPADARALAAATPNARAFHDNLGASISTDVARSNGNGTVAVRVVADDPKQGRTEVGIYTVSLRTGHVTDDDMEPAEDGKTDSLRRELMARHCSSK